MTTLGASASPPAVHNQVVPVDGLRARGAPCLSELEVTALLQEHDELVQLFIHNDLVAWYLNLALLAANGGLLSALHAVGLFDLEAPLRAPIVVVLGAGVLVNVVGYFVLQRRRVYRQSRLNRALFVEAELASAGSAIRTFSTVEGNLERGRMPTPPDGISHAQEPQPTRALQRREQYTVLDFRLAFYLVAATFLALSVWTLLGRPVP